jgi:hypothetical protein
MKKFVTTFLLVAGLVHGLSFAASYKVTKVIEVGPAAQVSYAAPLKWSPDGSMLAFLANNYLMVSDTSGHIREVKAVEIGITPRRFEWVSNDKVALNLRNRSSSDSALYNTLTVVDINTGLENVIVADTPNAKWKPVNRRAGDTFFEGPYLSLEGNAYYLIRTLTGRSKEISNGRGTAAETIDEAHWILPDKAPALGDNHFIRWYLKTGLYEIALTGNDSIRIAPTPFRHVGPFAAVSPDRSYVMNGGTMIKTADSMCIVLDTIPIERPEGVVACDFGRVSFNPNPKSREVLFELTCDGNYPSGAEFVLDKIGTFNYTTYEFTILDTLIGIEGCAAPVYAPDGKKIAFLAHYKAYIIYREEK